jgi:arylsulfatase A-like enzyme
MNPMLHLKNGIFILLGILLLTAGCHQGNRKTTAAKDANHLPNIVYILADDMGYGDLSVNNPQSRIHTPHIDSLAMEGMRFTDAHAASSVCTPSRYALLTGCYCWRSRLPQGVLGGYGRALIEADQLTIASLLKKHHYTTAAIGKWHLGLNWALKEGHSSNLQVNPDNPDHARIVQNVDPDDIDFTQPVTDGPREHGFDYSYILPASLDMPPYCYLRNDTLTAPLTERTKGNNMHPKGTPLYAIGPFWRPGLMAKGFNFMQVLPNFTSHAVDYINRHAHSEKPFFLYFAMPSPHTPWLPAKEFVGKSRAGSYGDYVVDVDAMVGKVLDAIRGKGLSSNTIIIFSSDNGPYWRPAFVKKYHHHAAYVFRGMKADAWEGGHRVPLIVKWDHKIRAGSVSNITTTLANLISTCSEMLTGNKKVESAIDSYSILPALLGKKDSADIPQIIINESSQGMFAVRNGQWKLIEGLGSGGFSLPVRGKPVPGGPRGQLYNLYKDSSETKNLYLLDPYRVKQMEGLMDSIKNLGPH